MPQNLYIVWTEKWEIGIGILDEQHRGIATLINTLYYFMQNNKSNDMALYIMAAVERYAKLHAVTEEDLLAEAGYPGLATHQAQHSKLAKDLRKSIRESITTGNHVANPEIFISFLKTWWLEHIHKQDMDFVDHVKAYLDRKIEA